MKILELFPYYFPEQISSSHLDRDLEESLVDAGFDLEIYTPTPTRGISLDTYQKYKKIGKESKRDGHIQVHRFAMVREGKNTVIRALRYLFVNLKQYYYGINVDGVDLIYSASTPPTQGILCGRVAKKLSRKYGRKVPYIYNLQDVFPDSLVTAGMTSKGSILWKIGRKIEDKTYRYADKIIVISNDIKCNVLEKGVSEDKIVVIPNWIDTDAVQPVLRKENRLFDELGLERDGFYVTYAGNLGLAQGVDSILDAAELLEDCSDIRFVVFGDGNKQEEFKQRIAGMKNVKLFPLQPSERVPEVYSLGDMSVVACKKGSGGAAVPSKTFSIMATATPVLLSFDEGTALWDLVKDNDCGFCARAGSAEELSAAIRYAKDHPDELVKKGKNARECVEKSYSKQIGTSRTIEVIRKAIEDAMDTGK